MEILDILQKEWPLIAGAPVIAIAIGGALILLTVAFTMAWKLKSAIDDGQIKERDAKIDTLNERLLLAVDREQVVQKAREELEKQVQELKAQVTAGASKETLAPITARVDTALHAMMHNAKQRLSNKRFWNRLAEQVDGLPAHFYAIVPPLNSDIPRQRGHSRGSGNRALARLLVVPAAFADRNIFHLFIFPPY